jgi:predicted DNA-binding transcriptional regulator AlpA
MEPVVPAEAAVSVAAMPPEYVAFRDLPQLLGIGRGTAHRYSKLSTFPKPDRQMTAAMGMKVWKRQAVVEWKRAKLAPKPGRPPKN